MIAIVAAVVVGAVIYYLVTSVFSSGGGVSTSALATTDLGHAVSELAAEGFGGSDNLTNGGSVSAADCLKNTTGPARQFLAKNQCQQYSAVSVNVHKQKIATTGETTWVTLSTNALAAKYQQLAAASQSGFCAVSGQDGTAVWVAQVKPTGHVAADREILQAISPVKLSAAALAVNCAR